MFDLVIVLPRTGPAGRPTFYLRDSGGAEVPTGCLYPPVEAATAAAYLRKIGHRVALLAADAEDLPHRVVLGRIESMAPRFVLVPTAWGAFAEDAAFLAALKERMPGVVTVVSGALPSALPAVALAMPGIDLSVLGEPEWPLAALLGRSRPAETGNLAYRDAGRAVVNRRTIVPDIEALPEPAWDLMPHRRYRMPFSRRWPATCLETSRGCPKRCSFCPNCNAYYARKVRFKNPGQVLAELDSAVNRLGFREIVFKDLSFTIDRARVMEICRLIRERRLAFIWRCFATVDAVDEQLLSEMRAAGCYQICYGFESGDETVLAASGKGTTIAQGAEAARLTRRAGIEVAGNFMIGLTGETEETARRTICYALSLDLDFAQCLMACPAPGTPFYDECLARGYRPRVVSEGRWYDMRMLDDPALPTERIRELVGEFNRRFYGRGSYLFDRLRRTEGWGHFRHQATMAWRLARGAIDQRIARRQGGRKDEPEWLRLARKHEPGPVR